MIEDNTMNSTVFSLGEGVAAGGPEVYQHNDVDEYETESQSLDSDAESSSSAVDLMHSMVQYFNTNLKSESNHNTNPSMTAHC